MNEIEYSQLAGHITEKLDKTAEYEDWLIIQDYIENLQSNLIKEQLAYKNLRDTFNEKCKQLQQRDEVIEKVRKRSQLEISASSYQYEKSHKQQDLVYKVAHERILDILNEGDKK